MGGGDEVGKSDQFHDFKGPVLKIFIGKAYTRKVSGKNVNFARRGRMRFCTERGGASGIGMIRLDRCGSWFWRGFGTVDTTTTRLRA